MNMTAARRRIWLFFLYLLYGSVLITVLLVLFFPTRQFRKYCVETVERMIPGTTCVVGSIGYTFPLTLRFSDIRLRRAQQPRELLVEVPSLSIRADPWRQGFTILAEIYDGRCQCRLFMDRDSGILRLGDVKIHHLNLKKWPGLQKFLGRSISGFLDITGRYSGRFGRILDGEARGTARVHGGSMELLRPILSLDTLGLQDSAMEFTLHDRTLAIGNGSLDGKEFNGTFAGMVHIALPPDQCRMKISGYLAPTPLLISSDRRWKNVAAVLRRRYKQSALPFVVSGTLTGPQFRFGG